MEDNQILHSRTKGLISSDILVYRIYVYACLLDLMSISGKVCLLTSIEDNIQTLPEVNMHARLIGTLQYIR